MLSSLLSWVEANCPSQRVRRDIFALAQAAENQQRDCHFAIGWKLTRCRRAYLVHSFGGEVFVFNLTNDQARMFGLIGTKVNAWLDGPRKTPGSPPPIELDGAEIDEPHRLDLFAPITGFCTYHTELPWQQDLCLRIDFVLRRTNPPDATRRTGLFFYPLLPNGPSLPFEFSPVSSLDLAGQLVRPQTAAGFVRFCTPPDPQRGKDSRPLSNAHGILVTFR